MSSPSQVAARLARVERLLREAGFGEVTASVGDAATLQGHPASYFAVAGSAAALSENTAAPPTAAGVYLGQFYYYRPASTPGQLLFCQRDSAGGYEWTVVAQAGL